jgi:hypothetical protein
MTLGQNVTNIHADVLCPLKKIGKMLTELALLVL